MPNTTPYIFVIKQLVYNTYCKSNQMLLITFSAEKVPLTTSLGILAWLQYTGYLSEQRHSNNEGKGDRETVV